MPLFYRRSASETPEGDSRGGERKSRKFDSANAGACPDERGTPSLSRRNSVLVRCVFLCPLRSPAAMTPHINDRNNTGTPLSIAITITRSCTLGSRLTGHSNSTSGVSPTWNERAFWGARIDGDDANYELPLKPIFPFPFVQLLNVRHYLVGECEIYPPRSHLEENTDSCAEAKVMTCQLYSVTEARFGAFLFLLFIC